MRRDVRVELLLLLVLAAVAAFLAGCPASSVSPAAPPEDTTGGEAEQHDELFVPQSPGCWRLSTSDPAFWGPSGYTLWSLALPMVDPFVVRDVELVKTSGNGWAGFGIVFSHVDSGDPLLGESMLLVMINTQQQYSLGEVHGSRYSAYTSPTWITCAGLARGYGVPNRVGVTRDAAGQFTLYLNGEQVTTFHDGRVPAPAGGGGGHLVVISPQDSFPGTAVSVTFTER